MGLIAASKLNHPIARMVLVNLMHAIRLEERHSKFMLRRLFVLSEAEEGFFKAQHCRVKIQLKDSFPTLRRYLSTMDERYVDLSTQELREPVKLEKMEALGLPFFSLARGSLCVNVPGDLTLERYQKAIFFYEKAGHSQDRLGFVFAARILEAGLMEGIIPREENCLQHLTNVRDRAAFLGDPGFINTDARRELFKSFLLEYKDLKFYLEKEF